MAASDIEAVIDGYETVATEGRYIAAEAPVDRTARKERWLAGLEDLDTASFVATAGQSIVGHLGVVTRGGVAELGMWVAAPWRGKGVGSALMDCALESAHEHGAHKVSLEVWPHNEAAIALYSKFGFEREGLRRAHYRRRSGELWDSLMMGLVLQDGESAPGE